MDWPIDNAGLSDSDLAKVFRYEPLETTVVRLLTTDQASSPNSVQILANYITRRSLNYGLMRPQQTGIPGFTR